MTSRATLPSSRPVTLSRRLTLAAGSDGCVLDFGDTLRQMVVAKEEVLNHCSLVDAREVALNQCELEYLRNRTVVESNEADILKEMTDIALWLEFFLRERGLNSERGVYSRRTFLKDAIAARPELAGPVA